MSAVEASDTTHSEYRLGGSVSLLPHDALRRHFGRSSVLHFIPKAAAR
jgi:hypothetical protein